MIARLTARYREGLFDGLVVDNFAGGGGAGLGIERALGRPVDHAINHDPEALAMHRVNHPGTEHHHSDVWEVDPREVAQGREIALAWFSPDCKHFSKAKGGKPVSPRVRGLAWVVVRWAATVRPKVIMLENVEEFQTWSPLSKKNMPCPRRRGQTFEAWKACLTTGLPADHPAWNEIRRTIPGVDEELLLQGLGYDLDHRELRACDYGAPTIRKRLFLIARCDGQPIIWPEVTHGVSTATSGSVAQATRLSDLQRNRREGDSGGLYGLRNSREKPKPHRTAAECIDWSTPCPSIFMTQDQATRWCKANGVARIKRPLARKTLERIAAGTKRFVVESADPYLVSYYGPKSPGDQRMGDIDAPLRTQTTENRFGLVSPTLVGCGGRAGQSRPRGLDEPTATITAKGDTCLSAATLVQTGYGEREGQAPRVPGLDKPLGTVVAGGVKHAVVAAFMAKHYGGMVGVPIDTPAPTVTTRGTQNQIVAAHLTQLYGSNRGNGGDLQQPLGTTTAGGNHAGLVAALLAPYYGSGSGMTGRDLNDSAPTVTTKERLQLIHAELVRAEQGDSDLPAGFWRVWGFLIEHLGEQAPPPIVVLQREGASEPDVYLVVDLGMRMLQPRELYRAQGFDDDYVIDRGIDDDGNEIKLTKTAQVRMCGNSVCPPMAEALVRANVVESALAGSAQKGVA